MSKDGKKFDQLETRLQDGLAKAAKVRGLDTAQMKETPVQVERRGGSLHLRWGDIELTFPAPSQDAVDAWWKKFGGTIANNFVTLGAALVGAGIYAAGVAAGGSAKPPTRKTRTTRKVARR